MMMTIEARNEQYRKYAMSKNELSSEVTFGQHLRDLITEGAIDNLYVELKKPYPKAAKEKLLGEIRGLETKLGIEPKRYNHGG